MEHVKQVNEAALELARFQQDPVHAEIVARRVINHKGDIFVIDTLRHDHNRKSFLVSKLDFGYLEPKMIELEFERSLGAALTVIEA